jgi:hypothetical protein
LRADMAPEISLCKCGGCREYERDEKRKTHEQPLSRRTMFILAERVLMVVPSGSWPIGNPILELLLGWC